MLSSTASMKMSFTNTLNLISIMNDSLTFEQLVEQMCEDPMFIMQCEANNRMWDEEAAAELEVTVDELHRMLHPGHA